MTLTRMKFEVRSSGTQFKVVFVFISEKLLFLVSFKNKLIIGLSRIDLITQ